MSLLIVTGASRGFGKSLVLEIASKWPGTQWDFVLTSTKVSDCEAVAAETIQKHGPRGIKCCQIDFSDMQNLEKNIQTLFGLVREHHVIFLNSNPCIIFPRQHLDASSLLKVLDFPFWWHHVAPSNFNTVVFSDRSLKSASIL